tara:strand:+ start:1154 stop:1654 length:501 start_codon:yes stop_codon:yes gene_type:complete
MERFRKIFGLIIVAFLICCCFLTNPNNTYAETNLNGNSYEKEIKRSLESLQDLDSQTWQIIVYPSLRKSNNMILRIVGYPGSLRMDHPNDLVVSSGRKNWDLRDITKKNKNIVETLNDSVAEFEISPLISELDKNRPLRLNLPGLINDLPIPPYLVEEWRTLVKEK